MIKKIYYKLKNIKKQKRMEKYCKEKKCRIDKCVSIIDTDIEEYCNFAHHCEIIGSKIGKRTSIGRYTKIRDANIGAYCSISWDVTIGAVSHPMENVTSHAFTYRKQFGICENDIFLQKEITSIGNDVWIGCGATILAGVKIGDGAVIGAGAVVTKDVNPYEIVVGIPAKTIKKRFDDETINRLNTIQWWNFDDNVLKENIKLFSNKLTTETLQILEKIK